MLKKIVSCLLVAAMLFGFAACGAGGSQAQIGEAPADLKIPDKKVAILVAPEEQYPEDYKTAQALKDKYPDNVIVEEYADSRTTDDNGEDIIGKAEKLAGNEDVGALIFARATKYTYDAVLAAKDINSDIITIAVEPEQIGDYVETVVSGMIGTDWTYYINDLVAAAKEQGAEYFVEFDYDRHTADNFLYAQIPGILEKACGDEGIEYIFCKTSDPESEADGITEMENFVSSTIDKYLGDGTINNNTVVFSTDSSVQTTLINSVNKNGLIYVGTSFPTAYSGIAEAYEVKYDGDLSAYVESLKSALSADSEGTGRFSVYNGCCLASIMQTAALYTAFDALAGTIEAEEVPFDLKDRAADAGAGVEGFTSEEFTGISLMVECYAPGIEKLK